MTLLVLRLVFYKKVHCIKKKHGRGREGFQKIQPVLNKVKPIVNTRNALFEFLIMEILQPSFALAAPNPIPDVDSLPDWTGNVTVALFLAGMIEETTYLPLV